MTPPSKCTLDTRTGYCAQVCSGMHRKHNMCPTQHGLDEATNNIQAGRLAHSSLLCTLATSPTSQLSCFLIVPIFVQHTSTSGYQFWRLGELDKDKSI